MKNVKYWLLAALMAFSVVDISAQLKLQYPKNVRFLAGGFQDKRPEFKTLEAALNDVKALATSENPYGFWVAGDTLWIADWDSVFTESGLTMKDSIDIYYVNEGKIKWMPFGFGGTGGGTTTIISQDTVTYHYEYPNWYQDNTALPVWQRQSGVALDSVDQHIFDLIVYTEDPLYIENDTLKIDTTGFAGTGGGWDPYPDTTTVVRTTGDQTIAGVKTFTTGLEFTGAGYLRLGVDYPPAASRIFWVDGTTLTYSDGSEQFTFPLINDADTLVLNNFIGWWDLTSEVQDSIPKSGTVTFSGTDTVVYITTGDSTDIIIVTPLYSDTTIVITAIDAQLFVIPIETGFVVKRPAAGSADLKVAWIRRKL